MVTEMLNEENATPAMSETVKNEEPASASPEQTKAFINFWIERIQAAKKHFEPDFKRMKTCMDLARDGADEAWLKDEEAYVVPVTNRHINLAVGQLYAKNPKPYVSRKRRRMSKLWDGKLKSLQEAAQLAASVPPDPNAVELLAEVTSVQRYNAMMDGLSDTIEILYEYFCNEQASNYKQRFKSLVRRGKVTGVGWVDLQYQRILAPEAHSAQARIEDVSAQVAMIEARLREAARGDFDEDSAKAEELKKSLETLKEQATLLLREGPVWDFPASTSVIVDPATTHLKTLSGTSWLAREYEKCPEEIEQIWKVDIRGKYTGYKRDEVKKPSWWSDDKRKESKSDLAKVYRVQHRVSGLEFVICEGYDNYLQPPGAPKTKIERFFTLFPLVFNEVEHEDSIYPMSDVWLARHPQSEINRGRNMLREHRKANRPGYYAPSGALGSDLKSLSGRAAFDIVEVNQVAAGEKLEDKLRAIPTIPIDPALYDIEPMMADIQRTVGSQDANFGRTAGATATESSIAENSRVSSLDDNIDDLDELLSEVAKSTGQLMLLEMSKETVVEIVGPGAVWPDMPQTREEIAKDLVLEIKAGSTGRPNTAATLAKMERGMPFILQLPGVNPVPIAQKYLDLLDIDIEDAVVDGLPSITALNAMMSAAARQPATGNPASNPADQGGAGGQNAPAPQQNEPQGQPAMPAPAAGTEPQMNAVA